MSAAQIDCVLCREAGGLPVWQGAQLRVIRAQDEGFPAQREWPDELIT